MAPNIGSISNASGNLQADELKAQSNASVVVSYSGGGGDLNDISVDATDYTGPNLTLRVLVVNISNPNQYRVYIGDGTDGEILINSQSMSTSPVDILNGLKVSWDAVVGHTNFTYWTLAVTGSGVTIQEADGTDAFSIRNGQLLNGDILLSSTPQDDSIFLQNIGTLKWENLKNYALRQLTDGTTYLNAASGKALEFLVNGARVMRFISGRLGIGIATMLGKLHVKQEDASGAIPVQVLEQSDVDESFIDFRGTSEAGVTKSISSYTSGATIQGFVKVEINGTAYWMPYYDAPSS